MNNECLEAEPPSERVRRRPRNTDEQAQDLAEQVVIARKLRDMAAEQANAATGRRRQYLQRRAAVQEAKQSKALTRLALLAPQHSLVNDF